MKEYKVYKIVCDDNDKVYVGQTYETLKQRFGRHVQFAKNGVDTKLYRAIRKYGVDKFHIELIEKCENQEQLNIRELFWIEKFDSFYNGYNSKNTIGKCGGDTLSNHPNKDEILKKISNSKIGELNPHSRKIKCENIENGNILHFVCMIDAQKYFDIKHHSVISRRCRGITQKPYLNKWIFSYE